MPDAIFKGHGETEASSENEWHRADAGHHSWHFWRFEEKVKVPLARFRWHQGEACILTLHNVTCIKCNLTTVILRRRWLRHHYSSIVLPYSHDFSQESHSRISSELIYSHDNKHCIAFLYQLSSLLTMLALKKRWELLNLVMRHWGEL